MRRAPATLRVDEVGLRFGGLTALDNVSFSVGPGEICGLIGPNGAGKTSIINCISRTYLPQHGQILLDGRNLLSLRRDQISRSGVGRTFQNLGLFSNLSVLENVLLGAHCRLRSGFLGASLQPPSVRREERQLRSEADELLGRFDLGDVASSRVDELPYGTLKRVELARALMGQPALLLLDEPAAGLTESEVVELGGLITEIRSHYGVTILLVEHHMGMVLGISEKVVVLDFGRKLAEGVPSEVARLPEVIEAYLGQPAKPDDEDTAGGRT